MKGEGLLQNTIVLGVLIVGYYFSITIIGYLYGTFETLPIISGWKANMPGPLLMLWNAVIYIVFPLCIAIAYIMRTRPREQNVFYGG